MEKIVNLSVIFPSSAIRNVLQYWPMFCSRELSQAFYFVWTGSSFPHRCFTFLNQLIIFLFLFVQIIFDFSRQRGSHRKLLLLHHRRDHRHQRNLLHQDRNLRSRPDSGLGRKRVRLASRFADLASRPTRGRSCWRNGQDRAGVQRQNRRIRDPGGHLQPQDHGELRNVLTQSRL